MDIFHRVVGIDELIRQKSSKEHGFSAMDREDIETSLASYDTYKQVIRLILYYLEPEEYKVLREYLASHTAGDIKNAENIDLIYDKRDLLLNEIEPALLSSTQKLLMATYLLLHSICMKKGSLVSERLEDILRVLDISEDFVTIVNEKAYAILSKGHMDCSVIDLIIAPAQEVAEWAAELVYYSYNEGCYVKKKILSGLNPIDYEHPTDKQALNALEGTPGLEMLVRKFHQYGLDKQLKVQFTGSNIKVTERNVPRLYNAMAAVCKTIHLQMIPDFYIMQGDEINAFTAGVEKPILVVSEGCAEKLTFDELVFVIGHEVGHIKSQHVLYHQIANILPALGSVIGSMTLGFGELISTGIQLALLNWQRKSEFTSDRAGLLACQNIDAAVTAMMKIAGYPPSYYGTINPKDFIKQAKEFEGFDESNLDKIAKVLSVMNSTHPWTVMRAAEMCRWIEDGSYAAIISKYARKRMPAPARVQVLSDGSARFCTQCGTKIKGKENFCLNCGNKL